MLSRAPSTISRLLRGMSHRQVRPRIVKNEKSVIKFVSNLIRSDSFKREITQDYILQRLRSRKGIVISRSTLCRIFRRNGVRFRRPALKNVVSVDDVQRAFEFSQQYLNKSVQFWQGIDGFLDNKQFSMRSSMSSKKHALRTGIRGYYKRKGDPINHRITKPNPKMRMNHGAKPVIISLCISSRGTVIAHASKKRFNATEAIKVYTKIARKVRARRNIPLETPITILEDNDPVFNARAVLRTKRALNIRTISIPPRYPCLNPLDYSVFAEVGRKLNAYNLACVENKKVDTPKSYLKRILNIMRKLSQEYLTRTVSDMRRRVQILHRNQGEVFVE